MAGKILFHLGNQTKYNQLDMGTSHSRARNFAETFARLGPGTYKTSRRIGGISMNSLVVKGLKAVTIPTGDCEHDVVDDLTIGFAAILCCSNAREALGKTITREMLAIEIVDPQARANELAPKPVAVPTEPAKAITPIPQKLAAVNAPAKPKESIKINMLDLPKPKQLVPKRTGFQKSVLVVSFLSLFSTFASIGLVAINNFIAALPIPLVDTFLTPLIAFVAFIATRIIHGISRVPQVEKYENENALGIISFNSAKISGRTMNALKQDLIKAGLARGLMGRYDIDSGKFFFSHTHESEKRQLYSLFEQHLMPELGIESRYNFAWAVRGGEYLLESEEVAVYGFNESKINKFGGTVRHFIPLIKFKVVF